MIKKFLILLGLIITLVGCSMPTTIDVDTIDNAKTEKDNTESNGFDSNDEENIKPDISDKIEEELEPKIKPTFKQNLSDETLKVTDFSILEVKLDDSDYTDIKYQWYINDSLINNADTNTYKADTIGENTYYCKVCFNNDTENIISNKQTVIIDDLMFISNIDSTDLVIEDNTNYKLEIKTNKDTSENIKYKWYKDDKKLNESNNSYNVKESGTYYCKVIWNNKEYNSNFKSIDYYYATLDTWKYNGNNLILKESDIKDNTSLSKYIADIKNGDNLNLIKEKISNYYETLKEIPDNENKLDLYTICGNFNINVETENYVLMGDSIKSKSFLSFYGKNYNYRDSSWNNNRYAIHFDKLNTSNSISESLMDMNIYLNINKKSFENNRLYTEKGKLLEFDKGKITNNECKYILWKFESLKCDAKNYIYFNIYEKSITFSIDEHNNLVIAEELKSI